MATTATSGIRARREGIVNAHIEAEAVRHDVTGTLATFRHPRYEVPAFGAIVDGAEAVNGLISDLLQAFPDFYLHKIAYIILMRRLLSRRGLEELNAAFGRALSRLERRWKYRLC